MLTPVGWLPALWYTNGYAPTMVCISATQLFGFQNSNADTHVVMCPFNRLPLALPESWAPPCRSQRSRGRVCRSLRSRRRTSHCPRRSLCTFGSIWARGGIASTVAWHGKNENIITSTLRASATVTRRRLSGAMRTRNSSPRCARKRAPPVPNSSPRSISTRAHTPASVRVCEETEQKSESCAPAHLGPVRSLPFACLLLMAN